MKEILILRSTPHRSIITIFVDYYKKQNGEFVLLSTMSDSRHARFPSLKRRCSESIEGELSVTLYINTYDFSTLYDTLKLECFIVDRALNHSNVITTPEIVVKEIKFFNYTTITI